MKLSVIVPVYNTENYLDKCLKSILNQSYQNIEVIIINDGSTDNSEEIINNYKEQYPDKIISINEENHGQAYSRNKGLEIASGKLISFVDSDDYIEPDMFKKMIDVLESENSDMVICDMYYEKNSKKEKVSGTDFENIYESIVSVCNKIFKKTIINNQKFIENMWYEDYNFFINLCLKNPKYSLCKEPLYTYNIHDNSTMNNNNSLKNLDIIIATEDIISKTEDTDIKDTLIVNHILLDAINRVQMQKNKDKKNVINKLNIYIHKNIKNIFQTKVYKKSSFKKKIILVLNFYRLSLISKVLLKIKRSVNI